MLKGKSRKMEWRILDARFIQPKLKNYTCLSGDFVCLFAEWSGCCSDSQGWLVQIWDAGAQKRVSTIEGHTARVGKQAKFTVGTIFIAWNSTSFLFLVVRSKKDLLHAAQNQLRQMRISLYSRNILSLCKWMLWSVANKLWLVN